ncbi:MAG: flagellar L-ring protein FlgH [Candidatus Poribacteria bacterium]|nr:flagellar L-ring protein FlgH [Candidatus Poribacteria bacterium]MDQ1327454.1 flagellar L-ring protein FlgH [Candidatus Poribacteria bacterium]
MLKNTIPVCIILFFCFVSVSISSDFEYTSLYSDHKACRIGDIVTIIIAESSKASKSDATQTSKKSGSNGSLNELFGLSKLPLKMGVDAGSDYNGSGITTRSGSMDAKISVTVKEVMPNGNLMLEGTRNVNVNDEAQMITISGIVRPEDIGPDNTVLSIYMANAEIKYKGQGQTTQKPGIVTGVTNILLAPFHWVAGIFRKII